MKKRYLLLSSIAAGVATGLIYSYLKNEKKEANSVVLEKEEPKKKLNIFKTKENTKISRSLLKVLNTIDNNRLLFIHVDTTSKQAREFVLNQLETLKSEEAVDEMWIADFYKQRYSRHDIIALANKKAIFYLSGLAEVEKIKISTSKALAKLIGNSLSALSTRYPSMERYIFEPMLDIYAPLKETEELGNFGIVSEKQLYRGSMPVGQHNYEALANLGIKTVINLKVEDSAVEYVSEQNNLSKRDINLHYMPMPNVAPPTLNQALEFLTISYNSDMYPVFFHCHRGADRTGVMAAVFRITQGYTSSWALVEAEKFNIASSFFTKKIDFVYDFENKWKKWKEEGKIPNNLTNFDFLSLIENEETSSELSKTEEIEELNGDGEN